MNIIDEVIPVRNQKTRDNVRLMIPVMIHWAKEGLDTHSYGELINAIGKDRFSGIGYPLGKVEEVLRKLSSKCEMKIPSLNALCRGKDKLPEYGLADVYPEYGKLLDKESKKIFADGLNHEAFNFQHWDWVLSELELQEATLLPKDFIKNLRTSSFCSGGEGVEHKAIKEYILKDPKSIGISNVLLAETEYILPSGDRLDVYFETIDGKKIAIEVKPSTSPDQDISRGIFQCVKYEAVMKAIRKLEPGNYDITVLLVSANKISENNSKLAKELGVRYLDEFKY